MSDAAGVIRRAVEAALAVARAGLTADPVVPPPPALRRYVTFAKQTARSLDAIARVVEADDEFRARVAEAVGEEDVGRGGWLWLTRPEGWHDELAALEADESARAADAAEQREERAATRRLAATEAALARAERAATALAAEAEGLRSDLAAERAARLVAESRLADVAAEAERLATERRDAVRSLKDIEVRLVERGTQLNAARARIKALEAELRAATPPGEARPQPPGAPARSEPAGTPPAAPSTSAGPSPAIAPPSEVPSPSPGLPVNPPQGTPPVAVPATVVTGVAHAAAAAASLADALAGVAEALEQAREDARGALPGGAGASVATGEVLPADAAATPAGEAVPARVPLRLPGGMFDDSVEAAEHLLRTPGAVLVVDGYNVTMTGWPDLPAAEQRRRLLAAVSDLAHRTSTPVELVFDGAEVEPLSVPAPTRALVRVRFSDPGIEADDVIIDLVGRIPAATPVIVASSDNRVRTGARRRGANLLHARQLVALLGR
jgi:predicted RNA-binding protein with PIN domain